MTIIDEDMMKSAAQANVDAKMRGQDQQIDQGKETLKADRAKTQNPSERTVQAEQARLKDNLQPNHEQLDPAANSDDALAVGDPAQQTVAPPANANLALETSRPYAADLRDSLSAISINGNDSLRKAWEIARDVLCKNDPLNFDKVREAFWKLLHPESGLSQYADLAAAARAQLGAYTFDNTKVGNAPWLDFRTRMEAVIDALPQLAAVMNLVKENLATQGIASAAPGVTTTAAELKEFWRMVHPDSDPGANAAVIAAARNQLDGFVRFDGVAPGEAGTFLSPDRRPTFYNAKASLQHVIPQSQIRDNPLLAAMATDPRNLWVETVGNNNSVDQTRLNPGRELTRAESYFAASLDAMAKTKGSTFRDQIETAMYRSDVSAAEAEARAASAGIADRDAGEPLRQVDQMYLEGDRLAQLDALQRSMDTQRRTQVTASDLRDALVRAGYSDDAIAEANNLSDRRSAELNQLQSSADFQKALSEARVELTRAKSAETDAIAALARDCDKDLKTMEDVFSEYRQVRDTLTEMTDRVEPKPLERVLANTAEHARLEYLENRLLRGLKSIEDITERSFSRAADILDDSVRRAEEAGHVSAGLAGGIQKYLSDLRLGATEQQRQAYEREMELKAEIERAKSKSKSKR